MAYAIIQDLTQEGIAVMQSDPSTANNLIIQTDAHTKKITDNNYGISSSFVNIEAGIIIHDIQPLTLSAQMEIQQASLGMPSAGLLDTLKNICSWAMTIGQGIIAGAIIGGIAGTAFPVIGTGVGAFIGAIAGAGTAIFGRLMSVYNYDTAQVELQQTAQDNYDKALDLFDQGKITSEELLDLMEAIQNGTEGGEKVGEEGIDWQKMIIYGVVGVVALGALMIMTKR